MCLALTTPHSSTFCQRLTVIATDTTLRSTQLSPTFLQQLLSGKIYFGCSEWKGVQIRRKQGIDKSWKSCSRIFSSLFNSHLLLNLSCSIEIAWKSAQTSTMLVFQTWKVSRTVIRNFPRKICVYQKMHPHKSTADKKYVFKNNW